MSKSYWTNDFVKFNKNITGFIIRLPKNCEQTNIWCFLIVGITGNRMCPLNEESESCLVFPTRHDRVFLDL